jgi:hypothetical protein
MTAIENLYKQSKELTATFKRYLDPKALAGLTLERQAEIAESLRNMADVADSLNSTGESAESEVAPIEVEGDELAGITE